MWDTLRCGHLVRRKTQNGLHFFINNRCMKNETGGLSFDNKAIPFFDPHFISVCELKQRLTH